VTIGPPSLDVVPTSSVLFPYFSPAVGVGVVVVGVSSQGSNNGGSYGQTAAEQAYCGEVSEEGVAAC